MNFSDNSPFDRYNQSSPNSSSTKKSPPKELESNGTDGPYDSDELPTLKMLYDESPNEKAPIQSQTTATNNITLTKSDI